MRRYKYRRVYTWSNDIAYIVGLIASDGCLYKDSRHINITSVDKELLTNAQNILRLNCGIKTKSNGRGGIGYYLQFSDVSFYDFLVKAGITPAKSISIQRVNVPDKFYPDFLRGYFDGDGCIYGFWDKRWPKSLMYYMSFCSASINFLDWMHDQNIRLAHVTKGSLKSSTRSLVLSYAKSDSKRLFNFMYPNGSVPCLKRKYMKCVDFFLKDPYADREFARVLESVDRSA